MADEFIHRNYLIKQLYLETDISLTSAVMQTIETFPAADVQPIVYCKDCKYAQNPNDTMIYCEYFECGTMGQKDFCSCAEQK